MPCVYHRYSQGSMHGHRKTYDMASVRRSVTLVSRPTMPAMRRAQIKAMYDNPLLDMAIATIANLFEVDDEGMK